MNDTQGSAAILASMPDAPLPEGVRVVGRNPSGGAIFAPEGMPKPAGSAARRFLSSAVEAVKGPVVGMAHGVFDPPQTPEEFAIATATDPLQGRLALLGYRFLAHPAMDEARKTAAEWKQANEFAPPWKRTEEQKEHGERMLGHAMAFVLPGIGPAMAQTGERVGTQFGSGDVAGGLGTLTGTAATYAAPEVLGKVARSELVTRSIPKGQIARLIRPSAADLRFGKSPTEAILSEGLVANNLEQLGDRVYDRLHEVGKQIDAEARNPVNRTKVVNATPALKPLDDAMAAAVRSGDRALFAKLRDVRTELTTDWRPFRTAQGEVVMRPWGARNLRSMSPEQALQFKRQIGDRITWDADPLTGAVNKSLGAVYGKLKQDINTAVPAMEKLNERYSNLVGAAKAIERRLPIEQRAAHWSLSDIVLGATGHLPLAAARHVLKWPALRTRAARTLYNLPAAVPSRPGLMAAPAIGGAASLDELRDEAQRRRP